MAKATVTNEIHTGISKVVYKELEALRKIGLTNDAFEKEIKNFVNKRGGGFYKDGVIKTIAIWLGDDGSYNYYVDVVFSTIYGTYQDFTWSEECFELAKIAFQCKKKINIIVIEHEITNASINN